MAPHKVLGVMGTDTERSANKKVCDWNTRKDTFPATVVTKSDL